MEERHTHTLPPELQFQMALGRLCHQVTTHFSEMISSETASVDYTKLSDLLLSLETQLKKTEQRFLNVSGMRLSSIYLDMETDFR